MPVTHADPDHVGELHHVELYTTELNTSIDFWEWLLTELGYTLKNDWESGRSWQNGPTYIVLVEAANDDPPYDRNGPGLNHLAFHAKSQTQVDTITACVRDRPNTSVLYDDQHPYAGGYYAVYCSSPQGVKVEVIAPQSDSSTTN